MKKEFVNLVESTLSEQSGTRANKHALRVIEAITNAIGKEEAQELFFTRAKQDATQRSTKEGMAPGTEEEHPSYWEWYVEEITSTLTEYGRMKEPPLSTDLIKQLYKIAVPQNFNRI